MRALHYKTELSVADLPYPCSQPGEVIIKVLKAGICNTDLEIIKGYIPGFNGIPGHEFIGCIEQVSSDKYENLLGKRVTAEINCNCNNCDMCSRGFPRHCTKRTVIGIDGRNGAFAEYISVPIDNVVIIPETITDNNALFIEPLAAAFEIQDQITITNNDKILIVGDGKLAHLIAISLLPSGCDLTLLGKHPEKTSLLDCYSIRHLIVKDSIINEKYDIVIEASGSPEGFYDALSFVRPKGIFVLKSTYANEISLNPSKIVVDEITLIGSRCGNFRNAVDFLEKEVIDLSYLISDRFPLSRGIEAFKAALRKDSMKVVIDCTT